MPLIKPRTNRVRTLRHICRLQEPNRDVLIAYARFIGESPDYVLNQLLDTTLARDRDFVAWRAEAALAPDTEPASAAPQTPAESKASGRPR